MGRKSDNEDGITKTRDFSWGTTEELGNNKDIDGNGKRSHEKTIWQEKMILSEVETR